MNVLLRDDDHCVAGDHRDRGGRMNCVAMCQVTQTAVGVPRSRCIADITPTVERFVLRVIVVTKMLSVRAYLMFTVAAHRSPRILQRQNNEGEYKSDSFHRDKILSRMAITDNRR